MKAIRVCYPRGGHPGASSMGGAWLQLVNWLPRDWAGQRFPGCRFPASAHAGPGRPWDMTCKTVVMDGDGGAVANEGRGEGLGWEGIGASCQ